MIINTGYEQKWSFHSVGNLPYIYLETVLLNIIVNVLENNE